MAIEIAQARAVKRELVKRLASAREVNNIGLIRHDGGWAVKVNLVLPVSDLGIPHRIDGVDILTDVVGLIEAQPAKPSMDSFRCGTCHFSTSSLTELACGDWESCPHFAEALSRGTLPPVDCRPRPGPGRQYPDS